MVIPRQSKALSKRVERCSPKLTRGLRQRHAFHWVLGWLQCRAGGKAGRPPCTRHKKAWLMYKAIPALTVDVIELPFNVNQSFVSVEVLVPSVTATAVSEIVVLTVEDPTVLTVTGLRCVSRS